MIKTYLILLVLIYSFTISAAELEVSSFNYPPFLQSNSKGFVDKLITDFSKHTKTNLKVLKLPAKRSINSYVSGKSLIHLGADDNFPPKTIKESYIIPLFDLNVRLLYLKENSKRLKKNLTELKGIKIGILRGSQKEEEFAKKYNFETTPYIDSENAFNMLTRGRVDFIIFSPLFNSSQDLVDKSHFDKFIYHKEILHHARAAIFISKKHPNALNLFNKLNSNMGMYLKSENYKSLLLKIFDIDIPEAVLKYTK